MPFMNKTKNKNNAQFPTNYPIKILNIDINKNTGWLIFYIVAQIYLNRNNQYNVHNSSLRDQTMSVLLLYV